MQAHAPKHQHHLGGSLEYLEKHIVAALIVVGLIAAALLAGIAINNGRDDAGTIQAPDIVVPAITGGPGDITSYDQSRFQEDNLYLPGDLTDGVLEDISTAPAREYSLDWARFLEANGVLPGDFTAGVPESLAPPVQDYSLDWARFFEANGVVGALIDPVIPFEHLRFLEENIYLPGYTPNVMPENGIVGHRDENGLLPVSPVRPPSALDIQTLEQNLYLPSDGNGFVDVEPQTTGGDRSDLKAYYEAAMGQGWFVNGELVDPVDMTYSRAVGSWINEGSGEGWLANGKPAAATDSVTQPRDTSNRREGAGTVRPATDDRPVERNR